MSSRLRFPGAPADYQQRFALPNQRGGATRASVAAEAASAPSAETIAETIEIASSDADATRIA